MSVGFISLRNRSRYTLLGSLLSIDDIIQHAVSDGAPAVALTDLNNMHGALEFSEKATKSGLQAINGVELDTALGRIVLLAMTDVGYHNLIKLSSLKGQREVSQNDLEQMSEGVICILHTLENASRIESIYADRFYLGVDISLDNASELSYYALKNDVRIVGTAVGSYSHGVHRDSIDAVMKMGGEFYDRNVGGRGGAIDTFSDIPEALRSTVEIAIRCQARSLSSPPMLPKYSDDEQLDLKQKAWRGLVELGLNKDKVYVDRLAYEYGVIKSMGFSGYFLIVSDFIQWAKQNDIPVGPGRGSGAGSLVAWCLGITDIDPLKYGLLFERFLNPDRVSMPDFDIDFCQERRGEVIEYVKNKYGRDNVAGIVTFNALQARGVVKEVGRTLNMSYGMTDSVARRIPHNPSHPVDLKQAMELDPWFNDASEDDKSIEKLLRVSLDLEGLYKSAGTHAAGLVIGSGRIDDAVPTMIDDHGNLVSQFNMKWVEQAGLVKFDFLGLKTLTVIDLASKLIRNKNPSFDIKNAPIDDEATFEMLRRGDAVGVFQLESAGMRRALVDMKVDRLEDLIALVSLYRPGPMDNIPAYCDRKNGASKGNWYLHHKMEDTLKETYGIIIYQEQVMQIARDISGYTLGEADLLRRAMGKKIKAEMDAQRGRFIDGRDNDISEELAGEIFDLLAKFADYGFNKSHAAAYAMISYRTAYLKANYRDEFMAALMTLDMSDKVRLSELHHDFAEAGTIVCNPDVNKSGVNFEIGKPFALSAIKGVSNECARYIVNNRTNGDYVSLGDFINRIDKKVINKTVLENLVKSGALDSICKDRIKAHQSIKSMLEISNRDPGEDLFGGAVREPIVSGSETYDILMGEYESTGIFFTDHPARQMSQKLNKTELGRVNGIGVKVGVVTILDFKQKKTKSGGRILILNLSDSSGVYDGVVFDDNIDDVSELLEKGITCLAKANIKYDGDDKKINIVSIKT